MNSRKERLKDRGSEDPREVWLSAVVVNGVVDAGGVKQVAFFVRVN